MIKKCLILLFFNILFASGAIIHAAPEVSTVLPDSRYTPQDAINYQIELRWKQSQSDYKIENPSLPLVNFSLNNISRKLENYVKEGEKWTRLTLTYHLKPQGQGIAGIDAYTLRYFDFDSQAHEEISITSSEIIIHAPPYKMGILVTLTIMSLVSLVLFIFMFFYIYVMKNRAEAMTHSEVNEMNALLQLEKELDAMQVEEALDQTIKIFKDYLAGQYDIDTHSLAAQDALYQIENKVDKKRFQEIQSLFLILQESRFSGASLSKAEIAKIHQDLLSFMGSTTPTKQSLSS